jgi:hypothetical protein
MSKIYTGQDDYRFNITVVEDITGYTAVALNVTLPDGTTTTWTPTVSEVTTGTMYYDVADTTILAQEGTYTIQPKVTNASGRVAYGEPFTEFIHAR